MDKYPGNSDRGAQENMPQQNYSKRVTGPVVSGGVQQKEKNAWDNIAEFFGLGECHSFRDYVAALSDMTNRVYNAIDTLLGNRKYQNSQVPGARVQYTNYYNTPAQAQPSAQVQPPAQKQNLDQYGPYYILFDLRADAEVVLAKMMEMIQTFHNASIDDMYDLAGITSPLGYTGVNYGWKDLTGVRVRPYGSKHVIDLPPAIQIRG